MTGCATAAIVPRAEIPQLDTGNQYQVNRLTKIAVVAAAVAVAGIAGEYLWRAIEPLAASRRAETRASRPSIGGSYHLTSHTGQQVTDKTYIGKIQLVFFGFTSCPDVCPTALSTMASLLDRLGGDADKVQPIFITVDPERDTQERLAEYVGVFHPAIVGLTGTPTEISEAARGFGVFYKRVPGETEGEYTMDHSASTFVLDAQGKFHSTLDSHETEEVMLAKMKRVIAAIPPSK